MDYILTESNVLDVYRCLNGIPADVKIDAEEYNKILERFYELVNYKK